MWRYPGTPPVDRGPTILFVMIVSRFSRLFYSMLLLACALRLLFPPLSRVVNRGSSASLLLAAVLDVLFVIVPAASSRA